MVTSLNAFLKAALTQKSISINKRKGHSIRYLKNLYLENYDKEKFDFDVIFKTDPIGVDESVAFASENSFPQDQMLRYPTNINDEEDSALHGFNSELFLQTLRQLEKDIQAIKRKIFY